MEVLDKAFLEGLVEGCVEGSPQATTYGSLVRVISGLNKMTLRRLPAWDRPMLGMIPVST